MRGREGVEVSAPPGRAALDQQQALGHEDEHRAVPAQLVERGDVGAVEAHLLGLARRVGHREGVRVGARRGRATVASARAKPAPQRTALSSLVVRGELARSANHAPSRRLVLPLALRPTMTFSPGANSTVASR